MATRELIIPKGMENLYRQRGYAPGVRVGDLLFVSGMLGRDDSLRIIAEPEAQFVRLFENLGRVLAAGGSGFDRVVELVGYFTGLQRDLPLYQKVKSRFIAKDFPAQTVIGVAELAQPGLLCELRAVALAGG